MDTIYLDHAATTYLDPIVKQAMDPLWEENYGNPSSVYSIGRKANSAVQAARATVAKLINAKPKEIVFTAGGTESINLAILGTSGQQPGHIITSAIEHSAVLNSCKKLEQAGWTITKLSVDQYGFIKLDDLKQAVRPDTRLVSIMYANNEIGTVQPIAEIAAWLKQHYPTVLFHTDACQAAGALEIDVQKLGVDLMTLNGSKVYGPKQTGILYIREGVTIEPIILGGGQERNLRSGTENVPGMVGLATALEQVQQHRVAENKRLRTLRNYFWEQLQASLPDTLLNGPLETELEPTAPQRLPNNLNVSFKQVDGQALLLYLDHAGICVSTGSACSAKSQAASHVLLAINCPADYINGSIRFSLGKRTTKEQIDYTVTTVVAGVKQLCSASI